MRPFAKISAALLCLTVSLSAQTNSLVGTNLPTRPLSMQEAMQLAVQHNFDIALVRYDPQIAEFQLGGAYGYYDPIMVTRARHSFTETEASGFDAALGIPIPPSQTKNDLIESTVGGYLPITGLRYDVVGNYNRSFGSVAGGPTDTYNTELGLRLSQPLLKNFWIDQGRLNIQLAKKQIRISQYDMLYAIMKVVNDVQQAYYDLIAAQDNVRTAQMSLELAQRLVEENKQKVRVGTLAPLDEKQAESDAALREADLIKTKLDVTLAENKLKNLVTDNYGEWHGYAIMPTEKLLAIPQVYDLPGSWLQGLALRPDFNALKEKLEQRGIEVRYTFNQLLPELNVEGWYARRGIDSLISTNDTTTGQPFTVHDPRFSATLQDIRDDIDPAWYYGARLVFPWGFRAERNAYKVAKAQRETAKLEVGKLHQQILVDIENAVRTAQSNYQAVQANRMAVEFAQIALDAEQKKLENGKSTSFIVLRLQRDLTLARALETSALATYNKALAALTFSEGTILDKNRITVQMK